MTKVGKKVSCRHIVHYGESPQNSEGDRHRNGAMHRKRNSWIRDECTAGNFSGRNHAESRELYAWAVSRHACSAVIVLKMRPGSRLHRKDCGMTSLDVVFRYGTPPTEGAMRAVD